MTKPLRLEPSQYDVVIHALGLHWANDPVGQIIQCRRALRPDGLFLGATFGGETLNELRSCLGQAEIEVSSGLSPRIAPMGEIRDMGRAVATRRIGPACGGQSNNQRGLPRHLAPYARSACHG